MFSLDSLKEIQIIKQNDRQKITLTEDFNGKKYLLKEIEGDKREIYKVLQKISCQGIPKIQYVGFEDKTIVVEEYIKGESLSHLLEQKKELRKSKILSISKELL